MPAQTRLFYSLCFAWKLYPPSHLKLGTIIMTIPKTNHWTVKESKYVIGANRGDVAGLPLASKEVSNDASVHQIENATKGDKNPHSAISKRECFATLWTHYKRWWCCYTLGGIIFLVIILPIL